MQFLSPFWLPVFSRGVLIYLFTHFDLMEVAFNFSEEGTDGLCWRDLPEVDRKGKRKDRDPPSNLWVLKRYSLVWAHIPT